MQLVKEKLANVAAIIEEDDMECEYYDENDNYSTKLEEHVRKYFNKEFTDTKDYTEMKELIYNAEQIIPKGIPVEIVDQIMEPIIQEFNQNNYKIYHNDKIEQNPQSIPQWFESNPFTPIKDNNPEEWNVSKKSDDEINVKITDLISQPTDGNTQTIIDNANRIIENYKQYDDQKPQPMEIDQPNQKKLEIPINMVTKNEGVQTDLPELKDYISLRKYNRIQKAYDDGKIFVNDLRNQNERLKTQQKKLTKRLRHLANLTVRNVRQQEHNYQLYMNEWHICEHLTQQITQLQGLLNEQTNEKLSRRFIMKIQQQIIRNKSHQIEELTKKNTELMKDIDEYNALTKLWTLPETNFEQTFTPETLSIFDSIEYSCQSNNEQIEVLTPNSQAMYDSMIDSNYTIETQLLVKSTSEK